MPNLADDLTENLVTMELTGLQCSAFGQLAVLYSTVCSLQFGYMCYVSGNVQYLPFCVCWC